MFPHNRYSEAEYARRRQAFADALRLGYTRDQIAAAAEISQGTASREIARLRRAGVVRKPGPSPTEPLHIPWRDQPKIKGPGSGPATGPRTRKEAVQAPPDVERYRSSVIVSTVSGHLEYMRSRNGIIMFGYDLKDAQAAGDQEWITEADAIFRSMIGYLEKLRQIISDPALHGEVLDTHYHREDVHIPRSRPALRAVD